MDVNVLGPLEVHINDTSIVPSAGKPRRLLALLALRAGRMVPVPLLMEEVWGSNIPKSAQTTLQTYILQLRRRIATALGPLPIRSAKEILTTRLGGYQLDSVEHCDLTEFRELTTRGAAELKEGSPDRAAALLTRGLAMWQGPALVDVPVGQVLETEVLGMTELHTRALELRIEADMARGSHAELLAELRVLTATHPLHENFSAQLIVALDRAGHTWRALEEYQRLRRTLVDELGVEPSRRLRFLHQQVLAGSGPLDEGRPSLATAGATR